MSQLTNDNMKIDYPCEGGKAFLRIECNDPELEKNIIIQNRDIVIKLDKILRERAVNYKKHGQTEVYENTMSLYTLIFGRDM